MRRRWRRSPAARATAQARGWPEVTVVLDAAAAVHAITRPDTAGRPGLLPSDLDALADRATELEAPALLAIVLGLRALAASSVGDTARLMADGSRAVALLDDDDQPPLDRCTGYVVVAAAFNTLRLWELVDELYTRGRRAGAALRRAGPVGGRSPSNRVLTKVEWAVAPARERRRDSGPAPAGPGASPRCRTHSPRRCRRCGGATSRRWAWWPAC